MENLDLCGRSSKSRPLLRSLCLGLCLGYRAVGFVIADVFLGRGLGDGFAEDIEGDLLQTLEPDATLAHVEFLAGSFPIGFERLSIRVGEIEAGEVDRHMGLLRGEPGKGQGLLGIAVVSGRINPVWDVIADHAVLHALFEIFVEMGKNDFTDGLDGMATVFG